METEHGIKRFIIKICEKITFNFATKVLVVSSSLLEKVCDYDICKGDKATVLLNGTACGVDLKRFSKSDELLDKANRIRRKFDILDNEILIGFVGRLVPDKCIGVLLNAFSDLCSKYETIRLIVIGDYEPHRGHLSSDHIKLLNSHEKIIHVSFTHQIEEYYAAMNILVLPTRREGFPYTLLEAAAMELPVIATKVTGCIDAVVDGKTGLLIEPQNSLLLSIALEKLIQSEELRDQMGHNARQRVKEKFTSERLLDAHVKLYQNLL
jgi:glycosyltransferase involved in cell wall biosynthesis